MNILFVTSEVHPYIKTGGLADVSGVLPRKLIERGNNVIVVLPLYSEIKEKYGDKLEYVAYDFIDFGPRHEYLGVFKMVDQGVTYYLTDNESYFFRARPYGYADDGERFIFFSKAVVRLMRLLNLDIDIVHGNDWFCGLIPLYIKDFAKGDDFYRDIKTVYTIHNITYQGIFPGDIYPLLSLSPEYYHEEGLKFYDGVNFMKAGIVYSDVVTTVSKTYAEELRYPYYGGELAGLIRRHDYKLLGIQNGIDVEEYNPETDPYIWEQYNFETIEKKKINKEKLQASYNLPVTDAPMLTLISRLVDIKGIELLLHIIPQLMNYDLQLVILGTGDPQLEDIIREYGYNYPEKLAARIYFNNDESHRVYAAGDFFIMPSLTEPSGLSQMIAMRYGNVPIVRETGGLKDTVQPYNAYTGEGSGYRFGNINAHELLFTIERALKNYNTDVHYYLMKHGMMGDYSWDRAVDEYEAMYRKLLKEG